MSWWLWGFITFVIGAFWDIVVNKDSIKIGEFFIGLVIASLLGPITTLLVVGNIIYQLDKQGFKIQMPKKGKKKKKQNIDPMLFEGKEKMYESLHDRVQQNLKKFKE